MTDLPKQQGGGALIMVIILLALSAALLNATRKQLDDGLSRVNDERQFLQQRVQASSALSWGTRQRWPVAPEWQCQRENASGWRSCLLTVNDPRELLMGDSGPGTIAQYQWVARPGAMSLKPLPHGWLDYCPLAEEEGCYPDEKSAGL